jgi:hypothetical protein
VIVIALMLMLLGRLGSLLVALPVPDRPEDVLRYPAEVVRIG